MARLAMSNKTPAAQRNTLVSHNISNAQQVAYIVNSGEGSVMAIMIALLATAIATKILNPPVDLLTPKSLQVAGL